MLPDNPIDYIQRIEPRLEGDSPLGCLCEEVKQMYIGLMHGIGNADYVQQRFFQFKQEVELSQLRAAA